MNLCSYCGDNFIYTPNGEECDDGVVGGFPMGGDGCSSNCRMEDMWVCNPSRDTVLGPSVCYFDCITGTNVHKNNPDWDKKPCDDGNHNNDDGCSTECTVETGWTCKGGDGH